MEEEFCGIIRLTAKEKYHFYNTLSILIKAVIGHKTTIDLRNEATVYGTVDNTDAFMNVTMKDCFFTDQRGDTYKYDMFFVHNRNIRSVHIPSQISIVPAIKKQLKTIRGDHKYSQTNKLTFKGKRTLKKHQDNLRAAQEMLQKKNQDQPSTSKDSE